jgi:DNA-directed RNA polymerase subunit L
MEGDKMASVKNLKSSNKGFELSLELLNFPVAFVNAIRRITLSGIPTVVVRDVQIYENTSQMPHEMLKHRMEMLPVNVLPDDATKIRDTTVDIHIIPNKEQNGVIDVTTNNFTDGGDIIMKDRDLNTPILFIRLRPGEGIRMRGRLALETQTASQVCTATTGWHIDPELAKINRTKFIEEGEDPRLFDNFTIQKSYSRDENGYPNWFDMSIESVGVLKSIDILKIAVKVLRKRVDEYVKEALDVIQRENDEGSYTVSTHQGGHTVGALMQSMMYKNRNINFVSYDIPHPLRDVLVIRFNTSLPPESAIKTAQDTIYEYCSALEKVL